MELKERRRWRDVGEIRGLEKFSTLLLKSLIFL